MSSLILAVLHRADSLLAMGPEAGQQGCVSPESQNHVLIQNSTKHELKHRPPAS